MALYTEQGNFRISQKHIEALVELRRKEVITVLYLESLKKKSGQLSENHPLGEDCQASLHVANSFIWPLGLPEECIAELGVMLRRMKRMNASKWEIRRYLFGQIMALMWSFYVQIPFENLRLPSNDRQTDD